VLAEKVKERRVADCEYRSSEGAHMLSLNNFHFDLIYIFFFGAFSLYLIVYMV
jgi:hypothetical protein